MNGGKKDTVSYIKGQPLGWKLKAMGCRGGVFGTLNQYSSEELYFLQHDVHFSPGHPCTFLAPAVTP
jgi:hypothetical protein